MGIRFHCPICTGRLHVKDFLAGKRGVCPKCRGSIWIPEQSETFEDAGEGLDQEPSHVAAGLVDKPSARGMVVKSRTPAAGNAATSGRPAMGPRPEKPPGTPRSSTLASKSETGPGTESGARSGTDAGGPVVLKASSRPTRASVDLPRSPVVKPIPDPSASASRTPAGPVVVAEKAASPANGPSTSGTHGARGTSNVFDETPNAVWHVRTVSGGEYGPADASTMKQWVAEGRVAPDAWVWRSDWPEWRTASDVLGNVRPTALPPAHAAPAIIAPAATAASVAGKLDRFRDRKREKRIKWTVAVTVLALIAVSLLVTLVVVLRR